MATSRQPLDFDRLVELSNMDAIEDPRLFGRDGSNPYYDFLYRVVQELKPVLVVEFGTCTGASTAYLCTANPESRTVSVDVHHPEDTKARLAVFDNLELWTQSTRDQDLKPKLKALGPIDILFIDTDHTNEQATFEYETYRDLVRPGGLILFDDIHMNDMSAFWNPLQAEKLELNHLHATGFGVVRA